MAQFNYYKTAFDPQITKFLCYGTVIYHPQDYVVDFGPPQFPTKFNKKDKCPRILLISTWIDGKWGFIGLDLQ